MEIFIYLLVPVILFSMFFCLLYFLPSVVFGFVINYFSKKDSEKYIISKITWIMYWFLFFTIYYFILFLLEEDWQLVFYYNKDWDQLNVHYFWIRLIGILITTWILYFFLKRKFDEFNMLSILSKTIFVTIWVLWGLYYLQIYFNSLN